MPTTSSEAPPHLIDPRCESLLPPPPAEQDYSKRLDGVIILVSAGDIYLAKACCASIRQSMGNIPHYLAERWAREVDTTELRKLPNVQQIVAQDLVSPEEARLCVGFWAKLPVFWASPYERFLYLDADTLVWGDLRAYAEFDKYDFIAGLHFKNPHLLRSPEEVDSKVFDLNFIKKVDATLEGCGQELANNGVFFARRNVFTRANLLELRQLPCWRCYEQGVLNFLRWRAMRDGKPRVSGRRLQIFPAEKPYAPEDRFLPRDWDQPAIIHWITKKPKLGRRYRASDDYRKLFLKMIGKKRWLDARLFIEDIAVWLGRHKRSLLGKKKRSELAEN